MVSCWNGPSVNDHGGSVQTEENFLLFFLLFHFFKFLNFSYFGKTKLYGLNMLLGKITFKLT